MTGVLLLHGHDDRCRENPEVAGNLAAVGELTRNSGNGQGEILSGEAVYCLLQVRGYVSLVGCYGPCFVLLKDLRATGPKVTEREYFCHVDAFRFVKAVFKFRRIVRH